MPDIPYLMVLAVIAVLSLYPVRRYGRLTSWLLGGTMMLGGGIVGAVVLSGGHMFYLMRLVCWTIFLFGPVYLLVSVIYLKRWLRMLSLAMGLVVLGVGVDAFLIEPEALVVTHHRIESPLITRPVRIVSLADIQTDQMGDYERKALTMGKELKPDLLLFPGDYIQEYSSKRPQELKAFNQLLKDMAYTPALGSFAVKGDVEIDGWEGLFSDTGVQTIDRNTTFDLGEIELVGLSVTASRMKVDLPAKNGFRLVFGHAPDFALHPVDADLLLAGHTHGGQVQIPFIGPLLTMSGVPKSWADGGLVTLDGGRYLIVSRGIGMERGGAPRIRFNCRPEIVVVDLVPARLAK